MSNRRRLYQSKHPFDAHAFEALCCGSWQAVELIRIKDGTITIHFVDDQHYIEGNGPFPNIRVRSRQATLSDCTCFLRPGVDVCVLSSSQRKESSDEDNVEPVWIDARISSIERKPHESCCNCQFYINLYATQKPLGSEKGVLSKEIESVVIGQISILQKLGRDPSENEHYRWNSSQDSSALSKTKLFLGRFLSDIAWLLVASVFNQSVFEIKSVRNKIVYQVLSARDVTFLFDVDTNLSALNFKVENGISVATLVPFVPANTTEMGPTGAAAEPEASPPDNLVNLRRSKRRNVQPDRFLGGEGFPETDSPSVRYGPYKTNKWLKEEDEMLLPLACLIRKPESCSEEHYQIEWKDHPDATNSQTKLLVYKRRNKSWEPKTEVSSGEEREHELAIVLPPAKNYPTSIEHYRAVAKRHKSYTREDDIYCPKPRWNNGASRAERKNFTELEDIDFGSTWAEKVSFKKVQKITYRNIGSRKVNHNDYATCRKRTIGAGAYKELIDKYMKNVNSTMNGEEPETPLVHQWKTFQSTDKFEQREENDKSPIQDDGENSEIEMLWREMDLAIASTYLVEDEEGSDAGSPTRMMQKRPGCKHDYKLDDEIGIICRLCSFVITDIKDIAPPFMQSTGWATDNKLPNEEDLDHKSDEEDYVDGSHKHANMEMPSSKENSTVWSLIPQLQRKLHLHQKKAFEFLWQNIAGALVPALMEPSSEDRGGCVVSHTPGAGKTFLIIAFLASYMKLFPGARPLVLAPKTTLYTWYKEFIKWEIPMPVHLIHGRRTFRVFKKHQPFPGGPKPGNDVMHVLDCLEKMQKWHARPSVLVMGYTSFLTLMREDSKFAHRRYMAKILRESPGLLVLDEGHNPRSTKSRLRKVLMKVETDIRILLSGTLFQNNFCEYFNTLCLARPKFINEVLTELDPKFKKKNKGAEKARHLMESRARKFFIDNIAKKIDSDNGEERILGLNMLRNITTGFIDAYEGGSSEQLPGLQIYTLLMNTVDTQQEILAKLRDIMVTYKGYPLELELLITLASIHPWLIKSSACVNKFFNCDELAELDKCKFDVRKGSKVKFVLNIVFRVAKEEKVLIFCHNIAPIILFLELFEKVFGWRKGEEVLVLTGDLELFDRGRVMDKFEEAGGPARILLASITACAEGISLTAASRVIMLDSEWNPSKTKQAIARAFRPGQQKMVYVYQLLATGTLEEDKYRRTTWKEWVSNMIFSEAFVEDPSRCQTEKIEDDVLREVVEEDRSKLFHMIMKNEKASTG